jgi:MFS family permease
MTASPGFLGWRMVGVAFVVDFIAVGFFFYSFGVFYKPIAVDLGDGSRFSVGMGLAISSFAGAMAAPWVGRFLDRASLKRAMIAGALIVSVGFGLLSRIDSLWQYYLILGTFFGVGLSLMGGMASGKLVANWFDAKRGTAFGIATVGISLSGLVMPVAATWLIATRGWRGGFEMYAIATSVILIPLLALLVIDRPEQVGQHPDGEAPLPRDDGNPLPRDVVWSTAQILRSGNFWSIVIPFALAFFALSSLLSHLVAYATDQGVQAYRAGGVLSISAGMGVAGKVVFGRLVDRFDPRIAIWISFGGQLAGLLLIMSGTDYAALATGAAVFGFGMGGVIPLQSAATSAAFGRLSFGKAAGLMRPFQSPITAIGVPLAGWIYDVTGSYVWVFQILIAMYAVACVTVAGLRIPAPRKAALP